MRELKFRAWDRGHEQMLYDIGYCHGYAIEQQWDESWDGEHESVWRYYPELGREGTEYVIEQFTGLHDKDGREVYEGDLVSTGDTVAFVIWHHDRWALEYRYSDGGMDYGAMRTDVRVIGNRHENSEIP